MRWGAGECDADHRTIAVVADQGGVDGRLIGAAQMV